MENKKRKTARERESATEKRENYLNNRIVNRKKCKQWVINKVGRIFFWEEEDGATRLTSADTARNKGPIPEVRTSHLRSPSGVLNLSSSFYLVAGKGRPFWRLFTSGDEHRKVSPVPRLSRGGERFVSKGEGCWSGSGFSGFATATPWRLGEGFGLSTSGSPR